MSHELKTPLTSLMAALEMLGATDIEADAKPAIRRLVNSMERSTNRLERIITDLLDVALAGSGGLSMYFKRVDLVSLIRGVLDEMAALAAEKDLTLSGPARKARSIPVIADDVRLAQIVQNLVTNAVKATPEHGLIEVTAKRESDFARIAVTNHGVELDESIRDSLFEPFRKSVAGGYKTGAGLGLSVVDALVKSHGGTVSVESGGDRVTFAFTLPLWKQEDPQ